MKVLKHLDFILNSSKFQVDIMLFVLENSTRSDFIFLHSTVEAMLPFFVYGENMITTLILNRNETNKFLELSRYRSTSHKKYHIYLCKHYIETL